MWDNMLVSYISFHKETWYFELSNNKCNRGYYLIMCIAVHQGGIWSPTTLSYKKKNIRSLTKISMPGLLLGLVCTYIVKAIFIYFTKNCDDITGTESQFSLSKKEEKKALRLCLTCRSLSQQINTLQNIQLYGHEVMSLKCFCFLLQITVMHLKHECQFSLSGRTVATVNASNIVTLKTGSQHTGHISFMGF